MGCVTHLYVLLIYQQFSFMYMPENIYHITTKHDWDKALQLGYYEAPSLAIEGFIHCSTNEQVEGVLHRYYRGQTGLLKLVIDPLKLQNELKYELAPSVHELFPHVYGPIHTGAVVSIAEID